MMRSICLFLAAMIFVPPVAANDAIAKKSQRKFKYIDIHTHVGRYYWGKELTVEGLIKLMDQNGIERACVLPLISPEACLFPQTTEDALAAFKKYPERIIPFCVIDPRSNSGNPKRFGRIDLDQMVALLQRYKDLGVRGFGEHQVGLPFDHPLMMTVYEACEKVELPILFHLDDIRGIDTPGLPRLENVLKKFPKLTLIGHAAGFWASISGDAQMADFGRYPKLPTPVKPGGALDRLLAKYPNLYCDLSEPGGHTAIARDKKFGREFIIRHADRCLFGTDYLMADHKVPQFDLLDELDLPEEVQYKVYRGNAIRILRLKETQPAQGKQPPDGLVRIASGVSGHIHPAACVTKSGAVVVIFGQSDYKDLRLSRSTDGGRTWSKPVAVPPTEKLSIYPGSLTSLADGRIVHAWNTWYTTDKNTKSRFVQYALSDDEGKSWSEPRSLPKNPDAESVIRHAIVELGPTQWLFSLSDKTIVYDPKIDKAISFGDGHNHGLLPIVRTAKGTLVSGAGLRSTDKGKSWKKIEPFPKIDKDGWRYDLVALDNGWLVASEVLGEGVGGNSWRFVVSRGDGLEWDFGGTREFYNPGRPIGGRACPKSVQLDKETLGTVFYDVDAKQPGGPGVFFLRTPLAKLRRGGD